MKFLHLLQTLFGGSLFLGGAALGIASVVYWHLPYLPAGMGLSIFGLMMSPPLRKSFRAFVQAMNNFPG